MSDPRSDRFVRSYLKTRHLVLLAELGRHGSIMQAAQAADLTQSAASKLLSELEHALGIALFTRLPRGIEPTWYGKVLIRRAGAALAEMDAAHQEITELLSGIRGRVAVGSILTPSVCLLPAAVNLLRSRHQRLQVSIDVDSSKVLVERLCAGELDIVIGRVYELGAAAELNFEPITDEPHGLMVRTGHPLLQAGELTLAELARYGWILPPAGSILRDRIAAALFSQGLELPAETVSTMALPVVTSLLMGSDLIAPMSTELAQPYIDSGTFAVLPIDLNLRMDVYGIITRRQHAHSPGAEAMMAVLQETIAIRRRPAM